MGSQPTYHGSPPIESPRAIPVFIGEWANHGDLRQGLLDGLGTITQGSFQKALSDHYSVSGVEIGYGSVGPVVDEVFSNHASLAGKTLTDAQMQGIVQRLASQPESRPNDIYVLYPEPGAYVETSGCAYHSSTAGTPYAVIPEPDLTCRIDVDNVVFPDGMRAMVILTSHEWAESVTNPRRNGWFNSDGNEIADLCVSTFGNQLQQFPNGTTLTQILDPNTNSCEVLPGAKVPFRLFPDFPLVVGGTMVGLTAIGLLNKRFPGNPVNKFIFRPIGDGVRSFLRRDQPLDEEVGGSHGEGDEAYNLPERPRVAQVVELSGSEGASESQRAR